MHKHWRDCEAWRGDGLPLSTVSNEAAKMYDASIFQVVTGCDDPASVGLDYCVNRMLQADPDFLMGRALDICLSIRYEQRSIRTDPVFRDDVTKLLNMAETPRDDITGRERRYAHAAHSLANGQMKAAVATWQDILVDYPTDTFAIYFSDWIYYALGQKEQLRDNLLRVLPHWNHTMPLYGSIVGMLSFSQAETRMYADGEKSAKKALEMNKGEILALHGLAHVYEMTGRTHEAIQYLGDTVSHWQTSERQGYHIFWHWALYHVEEGEYDEALAIWDKEIVTRAQSIPDMATLLLRLELEGVDVGQRWKTLYEICYKTVKNHVIAYSDIHLLLAYLGADENDAAEEQMEIVRNYTRSTGDQSEVVKSVGYDICRALWAFNDRRYDDVIEILQPIKYDVTKIGGSNAHLDLYNLLLIHAALRSPVDQHRRLAAALIHERKALKPVSPMTDRLLLRNATWPWNDQIQTT